MKAIAMTCFKISFKLYYSIPTTNLETNFTISSKGTNDFFTTNIEKDDCMRNAT